MSQNLFKRLTTPFLLMAFLTACGNVRFTASSSSDGTGAIAGAGDGTGGLSNEDNTPGDDGSIGVGGGSTPGEQTPGPVPPNGARDVVQALQVPAAKNQVDFLLVIDNSASMIAIQQKMAASMATLAAQMNNLQIDWQMCLTVTTSMNKGGSPTGTGSHTCTGPYCTGAYSGGSWIWGVSLPWANGSNVLTKDALMARPNIFNETIPRLGSGDSGTGDERGVKAAYNHFANWKAKVHNAGNCYRPGSSVAVILLSDEDERSVAGDCSRVNTALGDKEIPACREYNTGALRVLEFQDQPSNLVSQANTIFGDATRFTFNSIIAESDACQNQLNDNISFVKDGIAYKSPHYTGTVYKQASQLTGGGIASLCSSELNLNLFSAVAVNSLDKVNLECAPSALTVRTSTVSAAAAAMASPLAVNQYSVSGAVVTFKPALTENTYLNLQYSCN